MEEVQSWWEVPAVAHFCYAFRTTFNLFFFEIAELESALLNMQDPDMSISLERLVFRLLEGCYSDKSVNDINWEDKLQELFDENCEEEQNLFSDNQYFVLLPPRSKIEILYRLCEFRLDAEDAFEATKYIRPEDMQAKCMGKDSKNNTYWYFCDERLYKENPNGIKLNETPKKEGKPDESNRRISKRDKKTKKEEAKPDVPWSIACHNMSDWERLMETFTKSKNTHEKELAEAIKNHLPVLQERVTVKDHLLRKRFMESAPKRTSSRISQVEQIKKMKEREAEEEARKKRIEAEMERARLHTKQLKQARESRNMRAEMRNKAMEERAKRAELRKKQQETNEDRNGVESSSSSNDYSEQNHKSRQRQKIVNGGIQKNFKNVLKKVEEEEEEDEKNDSDYEAASQKTSNRPKRTKGSNKKTVELSNNIGGRYQRTYSGTRKQQDNGQLRVSSRLQNNSKAVPKYKSESSESEQESDEAPSRKVKNGIQTRLQQNKTNYMDQYNSEKSAEESDSEDDDSRSDEIENKDNFRRIPIQKTFTVTKSSLAANDCSKSQNMRNLNVPRVTLYRSNLLNSSGASNWTLDSKAQKLHVLNSTFDNLSPKRLKLDQVKSTASSTIKSPLFKENHVYKAVQRTPTPFITFGRIIPTTKPAIVRLDFRKPPNPPVSS